MYTVITVEVLLVTELNVVKIEVISHQNFGSILNQNKKYTECMYVWVSWLNLKRELPAFRP